MKNKSSRRGFGLTEAIVAEFLMIIALLFAVNIFPITRRALLLAENRTRAANLGQALLNQARTVDFQTLADSSGSWTHSGVDDGKPFVQTIQYQIHIQAENADLKWIWVVLNWTDGSGPRQLTIETQRTRR